MGTNDQKAKSKAKTRVKSKTRETVILGKRMEGKNSLAINNLTTNSPINSPTSRMLVNLQRLKSLRRINLHRHLRPKAGLCSGTLVHCFSGLSSWCC
jgi:hypothetical protein